MRAFPDSSFKAGASEPNLDLMLLDEITLSPDQASDERRSGLPLFGVLALLDPELAVTSARGAAVGLWIARAAGIRVDAPMAWAFFLRDIGTLDVPARILRKPGPLTLSERDVVRVHAVRSSQLLEEVASLSRAAHVARHHHERWDGAGYPDRLAGADVPVACRALAVGDAFAAMTAPRPYRSARSVEETLTEIAGESGAAFDTRLAELLPSIAGSLPPRVLRQPSLAALDGIERLRESARRANDLSRGQLEALFGAAVGLGADEAALRCQRSAGTHRNWVSSLRRTLACPVRQPLPQFLATAGRSLIDALGL